MTFRSALNNIINGSHSDAWERFDWIRYQAVVYGLSKAAERWKSPGEPAFVSSLLERHFTHFRLADAIEEHLGPRGLSIGAPLVSGVFIHQKPKVSFGISKSQVEIGDLLLVRQHFQSKVTVPQGRAFLMQAKAAGAPTTGNITKRTELHQFALYSDWSTPFKFPNNELGAPPTGTQWDFSISPIAYLPSSGIYGVVANTRPGALSPLFPDACTWGIGTATAPPAGAPSCVDASPLSLAAALEGFLLGTWGRPWDSKPTQPDHWSTFVERSLELAGSWRHYPIQRLGATALPRRRDVRASAEAFSARASLLAGTGFLTHFLSDTTLRHFGSRNRRDSLLTAAEQWRSSVGMKSGGDIPSDGNGANNDRPPSDFGAGDSPSGGISVLYVATFGDRALEEPSSISTIRQKPGPQAP